MASPTRFTSGIWTGPTGLITEAPIKQISIKIDFGDGTGLNTTAFSWPANAVVHPIVFINVRVAEVTGTTKTIDIGSGAGAQGLAKGLDVSAPGLVKATVTNAGLTLGDQLVVNSGVGADVASGAEIAVNLGGQAVTWTPGSADFAELKADIILFYQEVRTQ